MMFEIFKAVTMLLGITFFIIAFFNWIKPGMEFTENLSVVWFYSLFGTFGFISYRVATTGGI